MSRMNREPAGGDSEPVGVRIFRRGAIWYANFQHDRRQQRVSLQTRSKKEAVRRALRIESELVSARWGRVPSDSTLGESVEAYLDFLRSGGRAPKTIGKYEYVFRRVAELAAARKVTLVSGIGLAFVDFYRKVRADEGTAEKTRNTETVIIRQLVKFAFERDMTPADPLKRLRAKKPKPTTQPCWTRDEVERFLAASPDDLRPALTLLADTGMRFGEMAWLSWDDVELGGANRLRIRPKEGWKPKTGDFRDVPLSDRLDSLLRSLPRHAPWVVTMPGSPGHTAPDRQWTERRLLAALKRVLKGLGWKANCTRFATHSSATLC